jgi:hypothetical protein
MAANPNQVFAAFFNSQSAESKSNPNRSNLPIFLKWSEGRRGSALSKSKQRLT